MTLWGEPEQVHVQNKWSSCMHMTVIRMWLRLHATEYDTPKVQTHRNSESGYSSVITHSLYGCAAHWQHIMCSARHMGYDVAYPKMAWTDEAFLTYFWTCTSILAEWIPTQELWVRQQYKAQCHWGGRLFRFRVFTSCESFLNMLNKSCKWFTTWHTVV